MSPSGSSLRSLARAGAMRIPQIRRLVEERARLETRQGQLERTVDKQRRRIATLQAEVRSGQVRGVAVNSAERETELGYLFIVTYGRSGSTLLQGVLDSIPGYLIRGENSAALYRLYQFQHQLVASRNRFSKPEPLTSESSWYGIDGYADIAALERMRTLVLDTLLKPEPDTRVTGFKEIRWFQDDWKQYLDFLRELFPGAKFLINTRDHASVVKSDWWRKDQERSLALLTQYEEQLDQTAEYLGEAAYRVHYDDYVADHDRLAGMFEWLGEEYDRTRVDHVMSIKHSFGKGPTQLDTGETVA